MTITTSGLENMEVFFLDGYSLVCGRRRGARTIFMRFVKEGVEQVV